MLDEIMIDRLERANDRYWSEHSLGGMHTQEVERPLGHVLVPDDFLAELKQHPGAARVISADEWNLIQQQMTDDEKARTAYDR